MTCLGIGALIFWMALISLRLWMGPAPRRPRQQVWEELESRVL